MGRRILRCFTLFFLATCGNLFAQAWSPVGPTCFTSGEAYQQSLTGCNGKPYLAFYDAGAANPGLSVMTYNGSSWVYLGAPGFGNMTTVSRNSGTGYPMLVLDPVTCQPYVVFLDNSTNVATVETYISGAWVILGTINSATDYGPSIAVYNGTPYVSFGSGGFEYVMRWNGISWVTVGSPLPVSDSTSQTSLTVDPLTGTLYFTYGTGPSPVWKYNGTIWVQVGSPVSFSNGIMGNRALQTCNSVPYFVYETGGGSHGNRQVYVQMFNGTSWVVLGGGSISPDDIEWPSMSFCTKCGCNPVVSVDEETTLTVGVFMYQNGSWVNIGALPLGSGDVEYTSLWFDSNCNGYVAFMDSSCTNKNTVMGSTIPLACVNTPTTTPSRTATATSTFTNTFTLTFTATSTSTFTSTSIPPTFTPTPTPQVMTATSTSTSSFTRTPTQVPILTTTSTSIDATFPPTNTPPPIVTATSTSVGFTPSPTNTFPPTFTPGPPTSTFTLSLTPTMTLTSTNTFTPTITLTPTNTSTPTNSPTNTDTPTPGLSLAKTSSTGMAHWGDTVTYNLTLTVLGSTASGIQVVDTLPAQVAFTGFGAPSAPPQSMSVNGSVLTWTFSSLGPGAYTLPYTVKVNNNLAGGTTLINTALASFTAGLSQPVTAQVPVAMPIKTTFSVYNSVGELIKILQVQYFPQAVMGFNLSTAVLTNSNGVVTLSVNGQPVASWDGSNSNGDPVSNGQYLIQASSSDSMGVVTTVTQDIKLDRSLSTVLVNVYNESGEIVKQLYKKIVTTSGSIQSLLMSVDAIQPANPAAPNQSVSIQVGFSTGSPFNVVWDGTNDSGSLVTNGRYLVVANWNNLPGGGNQTISHFITVMDSNSGPSGPQVQALPNVLAAGQTTTTFQVASTANLTLKVKLYALSGELVRVLDGPPGTNQATWNASGAASGLYLAVVELYHGDGLVDRQTVKVLIKR